MSTTMRLIAAIAVLLLVGAGWLLMRGGAEPVAKPAPTAKSSERQVLYWYDPMRPDQHFGAPGRSPFMAMDLVPKYADEVEPSTVVTIDATVVQNLGVRTARVTRGDFWQRVDTTGRVVADEHSRVTVTARADGWVERLTVRAEGEPVAKGATLAHIYSPVIAAAQDELLLALGAHDDALIAAARARLEALAVPAADIARIVTTREVSKLTRVLSPIDGYVMRLDVREGSAVALDRPLFELSSHATVWVLAEVPERESGWIGRDRPVEVTVAAHPGVVFEGDVDYVYPDVEQATRTRRVRIVIENREEHLHPGMYADVVLYGGARRDVLLVPSEAVIRTGTRDVVIVAEGDGRFRPVHVELGAERGGQTIVRAGLDVDDEVVTSGQFLIDSEASLTGAYQRMGSEAP